MLECLRPNGPAVYIAQANGLGLTPQSSIVRANGPTVIGSRFGKSDNDRAVGPEALSRDFLLVKSLALWAESE